MSGREGLDFGFDLAIRPSIPYFIVIFGGSLPACSMHSFSLLVYHHHQQKLWRLTFFVNCIVVFFLNGPWNKLVSFIVKIKYVANCNQCVGHKKIPAPPGVKTARAISVCM